MKKRKFFVKNKWLKYLFGVGTVIGIGGWAFFSSDLNVFSFNFDFSKTEFNKTEINNIPTQAEEENERQWNAAKNTLIDYFAKINFGRYEEAAKLRNEDIVGAADLEEYAQKLKSFKEDQIIGDINISNIERVENESKLTTKVFKYERSYTSTIDMKRHGEIQRAYIVLRDGEWVIDYFKVLSSDKF